MSSSRRRPRLTSSPSEQILSSSPFAKRARPESSSLHGGQEELEEEEDEEEIENNGDENNGIHPMLKMGNQGPMLLEAAAPKVSLSPSPSSVDQLPLLPLNLSPVHSGIASSLTEESVILAPGSLDVIQPDSDELSSMVEAATSEEEVDNTSESEAVTAVVKVQPPEENEEEEESRRAEESQNQGLQLLPFEDESSQQEHQQQQLEQQQLNGIKQEQPQQEVEPQQQLISVNGGPAQHHFVTTGDLGNGEEKFILVVTGDQHDLLEGGYVTLQTTGPDGEPSLISVPASSLASMPLQQLQPAAVVQEEEQAVNEDEMVQRVKEPPAEEQQENNAQDTDNGEVNKEQEIEPYSDVYTGEVLHVCPADCSFYCKASSDMAEHLSSKHSIEIPSEKLSAVVFDSVNNVSLKCSHCIHECFRDVILTYRGMGGHNNNAPPPGKASSSSKKVVKRTVRQCKRCGMESSTKSSMIQFNAHVGRCHNLGNGTAVTLSSVASSSAVASSSSVPRSGNGPLGTLRSAQGGHGRANKYGRVQQQQQQQQQQQHEQQHYVMGAEGPMGLENQIMLEQAPQTIQCPICGVELGIGPNGPNGQDLNAHIKAFHSVSKPTTSTTQIPTSSLIQFICPKCGEVFGSHSDLARHQDTFHGERIKYECHKCKFCSDDLRTWNSHFSRCSSSSSSSTCSSPAATSTSQQQIQQQIQNIRSPQSICLSSPQQQQQQQSPQQRNLSGGGKMASAGNKQFASPAPPPPAANPQCPRCEFQTSDINSWNEHYLNCTLKYSK